jgi:CxxC motif-containing protein (DUF1111 family)
MRYFRPYCIPLLLMVVGPVAAEEQTIRDQLLAIPQTPALGGEGTRPLTSEKSFEFQNANSPREHQRPFSFGNRLFNTNWVQAPASVDSFDGLGPLFNRVSCSACHTKDGRGQPPADGIGPMESMLLRLSLPGIGEHGGVIPLLNYGDQLSERSLPELAPEGRTEITYIEKLGYFTDGEPYSLRAPSYRIIDLAYGDLPAETLVSPRVAPQMIGLGLLQSVPEQTLTGLADAEDSDSDGISGRTNQVWDVARQQTVVGRFGWKANQPNLNQQNAGAAIGDIGLTTSLFPSENCTAVQHECIQAMHGGSPELSDEFLEKLTLYTMTIAVPAQRDAENPRVVAGQKMFGALGCASCHMPSLQTDSIDGFPELSHQTFHPFSDLLLHDMGPDLADNRPDFAATGSEWRTPPLWGLGLVPTVNGHQFLLHDGRARGFEEAILWHGGEGEPAKQAFKALPKKDRDNLVAFLNSL